ncbi:hypothetical protein AB5I41_24525 [Sphingomonas sp. MMS24-JH45]
MRMRAPSTPVDFHHAAGRGARGDAVSARARQQPAAAPRQGAADPATGQRLTSDIGDKNAARTSSSPPARASPRPR